MPTVLKSRKKMIILKMKNNYFVGKKEVSSTVAAIFNSDLLVLRNC